MAKFERNWFIESSSQALNKTPANQIVQKSNSLFAESIILAEYE
jgi:hypothetical protein